MLTWIACGLCALVVAYAGLPALRARPGSTLPTTSSAAVALGLLLLAAAATLPTSAPWSPGQGLWPGILAGGLAALVSGHVAFVLQRAGGELPRRYAAAAAAVAAPGAGVALLAALFPGNVLDPLGGFSLGAVLAALLLGFVPRLTVGSDDDPDAEALWQGVELSALAALLLAAATYLASYRQAPTGVREWLPFPSLLAAVLALGLLARSALGEKVSAPVTAGLVAVPFVGAAALLAYGLGGTPDLLWCVLLGVGAGGAAWLVDQDPSPGEAVPPLTAPGLLVGLLGAGAMLIAFRWLQGFGVAVAGFAALAVAAAPCAGAARLTRTLAAMLLLAALYRVYTQSYEVTRGFRPDLIYLHLALVVGALAPLALAAAVYRGNGGVVGALGRLGLAGLAAAVLPLLFAVVAGERTFDALLLGLGTAVVVAGAVRGSGAFPSFRALAGLLAAGSAWTGIQLLWLVGPSGSFTRDQRKLVLVGAVAAGLLLIAVVTALSRRAGPAPGASAEAA